MLPAYVFPVVNSMCAKLMTSFKFIRFSVFFLFHFDRNHLNISVTSKIVSPKLSTDKNSENLAQHVALELLKSP